MTEEQQRGRFEGEVLTRLDNLQGMGLDIKTCIADLKRRVEALEHAKIQIKTFSAACGSLAACFVGVALKLVFK